MAAPAQPETQHACTTHHRNKGGNRIRFRVKIESTQIGSQIALIAQIILIRL
jgi:hypothetical protein